MRHQKSKKKHRLDFTLDMSLNLYFGFGQDLSPLEYYATWSSLSKFLLHTGERESRDGGVSDNEGA